MSKDTAIIVPVYNEEQAILQTIRDIGKKKSYLIVCVDDGSSDNSATEILKSDAVLITHPINLGQGAALQTGIDYALQFASIKYCVTYDADGQHNIGDVEKMLQILKDDGVDIVVGSRFLGEAINIPLLKRLILKLAVRFTNAFSGVSLTDTHNGLRVFTRKFAEQVDIKMPGMAHASEIIDKMGRGNWNYVEAPVTIHYSEYSRAKGQSMLNSVNILMDILLNRTRK
jgi:glycosyltransferase involved in cell wall biosynthesis